MSSKTIQLLEADTMQKAAILAPLANITPRCRHFTDGYFKLFELAGWTVVTEEPADWNNYKFLFVCPELKSHVDESYVRQLAAFEGSVFATYVDHYLGRSSLLGKELSRPGGRPEFDYALVNDLLMLTEHPAKALLGVKGLELAVSSTWSSSLELPETSLRSLSTKCVYIGISKQDRNAVLQQFPVCSRVKTSTGKVLQTYAASATSLLLNSSSHYGELTVRLFEALPTTVCLMPPIGFQSNGFDLFSDQQLLAKLRVETNEQAEAVIKLAATDREFRSYAISCQTEWLKSLVSAANEKTRRVLAPSNFL